MGAFRAGRDSKMSDEVRIRICITLLKLLTFQNLEFSEKVAVVWRQVPLPDLTSYSRA